ncbi:hypothetical protein [Tropicimonas sp. IMCC34043]|uniref:hypothetical protein n=1 Tax=Tropicimonas sp. IMCC34043 TaxID=2248760 RepID=UPI000E2372FA|nr:hypothetical protein [Tropicimonas sp. IMCC34043]
MKAPEIVRGRARTDDELRGILDFILQCGGNAAEAARRMGIADRSIYAIVARAAARGVEPSNPAEVPAGHVIKGVSVLHTLDPATGAMVERARWTKTREEGVTPEDFVEAILAEADTLRGAAPIVAPPAVAFDAAERFHLFPWPDFHLGMLAWGAETGEDYDLKIAERLVMDAFEQLVGQMPDANQAILLGLGDLVHFDDDRKRTERSGAVLDGDSRHAKVRRVTIRLVIWAIRLLLSRFPRVLVRILPGNHDERTAGAIADALSLIYETEPRVEFDLDPGLWWFFRRGLVQIGATHGHTCKPAQMPGVMAVRRAEDWAAAKVRRFYHGHLHNRMIGEELGTPIECLQTVAPPDAWHAGAGYGAGRSLVGIGFHDTAGEIGRAYVNILDGRVAQ